MKLITANHLKTGRVIYYQASPEGWTSDPEVATAFHDEDAQGRLAALEAAPGDALGPYRCAGGASRPPRFCSQFSVTHGERR